MARKVFEPNTNRGVVCRLVDLLPELSRHAVYSLPIGRSGVRKLFKNREHKMALREWPVGGVYCLGAKKERDSVYHWEAGTSWASGVSWQNTQACCRSATRKPVLRLVRKQDDGSSDLSSVLTCERQEKPVARISMLLSPQASTLGCQLCA